MYNERHSLGSGSQGGCPALRRCWFCSCLAAGCSRHSGPHGTQAGWFLGRCGQVYAETDSVREADPFHSFSRQFRQLKRLDNVGIHFNTDGLLQEMDAQNQPGDVFLSHQNPFAALQRAEADADFPAHLQIRMKIVWERGFDEAADGVGWGIGAGLPSNMTNETAP